MQVGWDKITNMVFKYFTVACQPLQVFVNLVQLMAVTTLSH